ncbi:alpha/beta hydrolase [Aureimonas sp. AU22]|uniref:alpha/beta hydrolase n=1 Tax=Aureimonas sp. AU22 TaxID=1638162 RepID=UPI000A71EE59|nr:alpha/beta hydrolase [Aureimonas sp. AU22]
MTNLDQTQTDRSTVASLGGFLRMAAAGAMAMGLATVATTSKSLAQDLSNGAANFYVSDAVTVQPITFQTQYRTMVAGNIFIPKDLDRSVDHAAIVVGHPMGAVKEQSANLYATKMAERGFVTVSLDLPYWGGSSGEPRNAVAPELYAEAFSAAVDYLGRQDFVDRDRIGAIGICGSGSFVVSAAKIDPRIRSIATVSMYDMGAANRNALQNSLSVEDRKAVIAAAAEQRWAEVDGAETAVTGGTTLELTADTHPIQREFYDFYRTERGRFTPEGASAERTTMPTLTSNVKFMNFYPFNDIETIGRPMMFISGDQAHSKEFSEKAYELASEPKELVWVKGAGHVDLYDRVDLIPFDRLDTFFQGSLAERAAALSEN